jgi:hypothetical protein
MRGKPPINRGLVAFGLINPGVFLYMLAFNLFQNASADLDIHRSPTSAIGSVLLSSLVIVFVLRLTSGMRWKKMVPQEVEVDYVQSIVRPILNDLPKGTRCDLVFNPFGGEWSRVERPAPERSGYTYESYADILLRLRVPLDDVRSLKLAIYELSVSKTKNRKSKYKGTKHTIVVRYDIPVIAGTQGRSTELKQQLEKALAGTAQGELTLAATKQRISVWQVNKKLDSNRELMPDHLVPVQTILRTVAFLSRASLPPATAAPIG